MDNRPQISVYKYGDLKVMLVSNGHTISQVLEAFENVLRGSGFHFRGQLDFCEEE